MAKLIRINQNDNVFVVSVMIEAGEEMEIEGLVIKFTNSLGLGHKIAATQILQGEKIIKFGVPIGSATMDIPLGSHVHLHNLKSDYISTYTLDNEFIKSN